MRVTQRSELRYLLSAGLVASLILCTAVPAQELQRSAAGLSQHEVRDKLRHVAQLLADLRDRPRRVVYTTYPVSAQHGLVRGFVHVGDGSAVLARADLVVDAALPIVVRRAYHSARGQSREFGATGWHLTIAERIERRNGGRYRYVYGNGMSLDLDRRGRVEAPLQAYLSDVADVQLAGTDAIEVRSRTGIRKVFRQRTDAYVLASVSDPHGNSLDFQYTAGDALSAVRSSSGAWITLERDEQGRVVRIEDSHSRVVTYAYDAVGRLVAVTDIGGQRWQYSYLCPCQPPLLV